MIVEHVLAFDSTNEAIRAEAALMEHGLLPQVMPLPSSIRAGCGICLRLPQTEAGRAATLLTDANICGYRLYEHHISDGLHRFAECGDAFDSRKDS